VSVLLGNGNGSFENQMTYSTGLQPFYVAIGDFNKDTRLDIVVPNSGSSNVSVLLGNGDGSFANQMTYSTDSYPSSVAVGDFNKDTQLDIVVTNTGTSDVSILLGYMYIVFTKQMTLTTGNSSRPRSFVIADFNNDDQMDIGVANSGTDNIGIFIGYGNISFANQVTYSTGPNSSPYSVASGDFNNDTHMDIVVANYNSNNVGVFFGNGNGFFANQTTYSTDLYSFPYSVVVGDFNNDTRLDIAVTNYGANYLGILLGQDQGTFATQILFPMNYGSQPFFFVVGDFNNDRKLDFAVANNGTDSLHIFLQTC
jgi:predicted nucleotidyltransferase